MKKSLQPTKNYVLSDLDELVESIHELHTKIAEMRARKQALAMNVSPVAVKIALFYCQTPLSLEVGDISVADDLLPPLTFSDSEPSPCEHHQYGKYRARLHVPLTLLRTENLYGRSPVKKPSKHSPKKSPHQTGPYCCIGPAWP